MVVLVVDVRIVTIGSTYLTSRSCGKSDAFTGRSNNSNVYPVGVTSLEPGLPPIMAGTNCADVIRIPETSMLAFCAFAFITRTACPDWLPTADGSEALAG